MSWRRGKRQKSPLRSRKKVNEKVRKGRQEASENVSLEKTKKVKKIFQRRVIQEGDLLKEVFVEKDTSCEEVSGSFRSSWAKQLESELAGAAAEDGRVWLADGKEQMERKEDQSSKEDNVWRRLGLNKKSKSKIRKPIEVKDWFGMDSSESESSSQDEEESEWSEVDRKARNRKKLNEKKIRRKEKIGQIVRRMKQMIGLGPIPKATRDFLENKSKDKKVALSMCVKEYLKYYLDFKDDELEKIDIVDSKLAANDDVIYVALGHEEQIREIYRRKAASENDDLILRDYIPPQFHARYMAIAAKAKETRLKDNRVKTQIRWGNNDIEIFTRMKGSEEGFKKVDLKEFMEQSSLPEFDGTVKWRNRGSQTFKKKMLIGQNRAELPSLAAARMEGQSLTRKHSRGGRDEPAKKQREEDPLAGTDLEMDELEDENRTDSNNEVEYEEYL